MSATTPLLPVVVPAYNSQDYLDRALATLIDCNDEIEVPIINDESKDNTARMVDEWALHYPGIVRVIHQENKGHGGAMNTGVRAANGTHMRVCGSSDQVDRPATNRPLNLLREERAVGHDLDPIVTNYVYKKQGKAYRTVARYRSIPPQGKTITQEEARPCHHDQYMMMYSLTMCAEILRRSGLTLLEHTFYVDYLYSHTPSPLMHTIRYLDVDLYRYFIRHDDQSMNKKIVVSRLDQLLCVNREMVAVMPKPEEVPANLCRYMTHYLHTSCVITTMMAQLSGTLEHLEMENQMWNEPEAIGSATGATVRLDLLARLARPRSRRFVTAVYSPVRTVMGFN